MAKDPAVLFYPNDFIASTALWDDAEVGVYIRLLSYQHINGGITPSDYEKLCYGYERVREKFNQHEDGLYYNDRMLKESLKRQRYVDSRIANGEKGGRPKTIRLSENEPNENHMDNHMDMHMGNHMGNRNRYSNSNNISNRDINIPSIDNSDSNSSNKYLDRFTEFWQIYPKKTGKEAAKREFLRIKPSQELTDRMIEKIKELCQSDQWRRDGGKFIPNPSTWLHQGRWDDETSISLYREAKKTADEPIPF